MFTTSSGDIFTAGAHAIAHGVNTRGVMGAGIAVKFREAHPGMYAEYRKLCEEFGGALGGLVFPWTADNVIVYNLFTQIMPGANADYALLEKAALMMRLDAEERGLDSVALPEIGCGIGGLEYHNVESLLDHALKSSSVEFTMYSYSPVKEDDGTPDATATTGPVRYIPYMPVVPTPADVFGGKHGA